MKDSPFVHESSSTNRVPEVIQNMYRVFIEFQNLFPESVLGIVIRALHLSLVINHKLKERKIICIQKKKQSQE